jgi:hypothetical protein
LYSIELEAGLEERRMILEDCRLLKQYAIFQHLHPENPVGGAVDPTAFARCYFDRPSAPQQKSYEDAGERVRILKESQALRTRAADCLLPEFQIAHATDRDEVLALAEETEEEEPANDATEIDRKDALADAEALKMYAHFHMHPEEPVQTTDAFACERNFFDRPSAPERETQEEAEEHHQILEDARQLENLVQLQNSGHVLAQDYFHHSDCMDEEDIDYDVMINEAERKEVIEDVEALKMYAHFHLHPEEPVKTTDAFACERNFFDRPSAPERETQEEAEEHHRVLEDAKHLEDLVQLQLTGHVLEQDYFHCNFAMDEDLVGYEDSPVVEDKENEPASEVSKTEGEGNLSRSPSSIFEFN